MNPTFTPEPPTKPGAYLWKHGRNSGACVVEVSDEQTFLWCRMAGDIRGHVPEKFGGLWCRLVPAEEVERAFREAVESYYDSAYPSPTADDLWKTSRAKRVMEGEV